MLPSAESLAKYDPLLPDSRVEQLEDRLRREMKLPDVVTFATVEQPPTEVVRRGVLVTMPAQAVFLVVSPNPHPRHRKQLIKTFAAAELAHWREKEDTAWRFAGAGDPAEPIFRELCRQHLAARQNYAELN